MASVGAFEAKTHLSALLERVARGESITITRHGKAVARLVPAEPTRADFAGRRKAIKALKALSKRYTLRGVSIKELRNEGRK